MERPGVGIMGMKCWGCEKLALELGLGELRLESANCRGCNWLSEGLGLGLELRLGRVGTGVGIRVRGIPTPNPSSIGPATLLFYDDRIGCRIFVKDGARMSLGALSYIEFSLNYSY